MTIRFSDEKVILGLPQENDRSATYCSDAGTTFVDLYRASSLSGSASIPELFSISLSGEVKRIYLGACLIAGIRLAREKSVNHRVIPTSNAIDESVDLAHEIYNRVFRKVPDRLNGEKQ